MEQPYNPLFKSSSAEESTEYEELLEHELHRRNEKQRGCCNSNNVLSLPLIVRKEVIGKLFLIIVFLLQTPAG